MEITNVPLNDGTERYYKHKDGKPYVCIVCRKPLEFRHGCCCHKCDKRFIDRFEAGKKGAAAHIYDHQRSLPVGYKLTVGFALMNACRHNY